MRVNELFLSIQGEGLDVGRLCTFVRFTACNIRCGYCDTAYAFYEGDEWTLDQIVARVERLGAPMVCLTGGEPMLQEGITELMGRLLERGLHVVIETNGTIPLDDLPKAVVKVMDIKTPGALRRPESRPGFAHSPAFLQKHLLYSNLDTLDPTDQVKFVICDRADYDWALAFVDEHDLANRAEAVLFSPVTPGLDPTELVDWMKTDNPPARLNLQVHKTIWGVEAQGV